MAPCSSSGSEDAIVIDRDDISNYNPAQILPEEPKVIEKIREWLKPTDYLLDSGEYHKHLASHMPGTGAWLTSSETYREWLNGEEHGLLWIKGIPGSGKSVVAAHIIDELSRAHPGIPILYFFFRQIIDANHEPVALLRDWLDQILMYSPPLQKALKEIWKGDRTISSLSMEDLWKHLRLGLSGLQGKAFCVADALDEMDQGNDEFLKSLAVLGQWWPEKVKVLMTSRLVPSIEIPLRRKKALHIRLDETEVDVDISSYVAHGLNSSTIAADDRELIREAIPGRANGLFLYAKLAMDAFLKPGAHAKTVLEALPADLHEMYTNLLHEHSQRSGVPAGIQLFILQWVTHAARPLRLLEVAEILNVAYRPEDERDLKATKDLVRAAAGPLLEILPDETVSVIHHSFTEYLKCTTRLEDDGGYTILRLGSTNGRLALACLTYLQSGCLDGIKVTEHPDDLDPEIAHGRLTRYGNFHGRDHKKGWQEKQQLRLKHPFLTYAVSNWHIHVAKSMAAGFPQDDINRAIGQFLNNDHRMKAWLKLQEECDYKGVTRLHVAARHGLTDYAGTLIIEQADVHAVDEFGRTPIAYAAKGGHADVIRLLVKAGADPDVDDEVGGLKPLHEAASENHSEAVRALLEAGVSPLTGKTCENPGRTCGNAPRSRGHTPLMYACDHGHLEALEAFLPFLKNIEIVHRALAWSSRSSRAKLVERILRHPGVDVNAKVRGDTALFLACKRADRDTVVVLIEAGADPTILCENPADEFAGGGGGRSWEYYAATKKETRGFTALHALCRSQRHELSDSKKEQVTVLQELFGLLLQKGANIHQRTYCGTTALHAAVNNPILVRLLLDAGADANAVDDDGRTPIHMVTDAESLGLLVEEGNADINKFDPHTERSPLLIMLGGYHKEVILKLLEYGPDLGVKDKKGNSLLHIALGGWNDDTTIVKAILAAGADPNERNRDGETAILQMPLYKSGWEKTLDILLEAGADINATNPKGLTLLSKAMGDSMGRSDHSEVTMLLERGANLSVRDYQGRTLLHHVAQAHRGTINFAKNEKDSRLNFMISLGLDVHAVDYGGNTLLHELASKPVMHDSYSGPQYISLWKELFGLGLSLETGNHLGRTPLHYISSPSPHTYRNSCFKPNHYSPLDLVLSETKHIDQKDHLGLTPLHLAVTVCEYVTKKLLGAGADPTVRSTEGLTPLHLAARARQSNIVGLILEALKDVRKGANAEDENGNTPLYYACRSGRPETVRLLIDAGADASRKGLFLSCAAFEEENELWSDNRTPSDTDANISATGLTINDKTRPFYHTNTGSQQLLDPHHDTVRLEEILDMLIDNGADASSLVADKWNTSQALSYASRVNHDYTYDCLFRARERLLAMTPQPDPLGADFSAFQSKIRRGAELQAVKEYPHVQMNGANTDLVVKLLKNKQYHTMEPLFHKGVDFLAKESDRVSSNMELFIQHGFANLVDMIGTLEAQRHLEKGDWHAFGDTSESGLYHSWRGVMDHDSIQKRSYLLFEAASRELPNMEVVRLLVEKFHVGTNEYRYEAYWKDNDNHICQTNTVLHQLAVGKSWWQASLALPYLISQGANVNAKDRYGMCPLHIALGNPRFHVGPFHKDAVRALVAAGADVNAVDGDGKTCLSYAGYDVELVKVLVENGAIVTAEALFTAIEGINSDVLEALLATGVDANMRREPPSPEQEQKAARTRVRFRSHELHALYAAARKYKESWFRDTDEDKEERQNMISQLVEALLAAGADPYATFKTRNFKYQSDHNPNVDEDERPGDALSLVKRASEPEFHDVMIFHELLEDENFVDAIFTMPNLDVNRRDSRGRTPLHLACHSSKDISRGIKITDTNDHSETQSIFDYLLSRGADPFAIDGKKHNLLHHQFIANDKVKDEEPNISIITRLTKDYPQLINQADIHGKTPLHLALIHAVQYGNIAPVEALLSAGASPNAIDNDGNTTLHLLAFRICGSATIRNLFTTFLSTPHSLSINARNARGETPVFRLHSQTPLYPVKGEKWSVAKTIQFFQDAGADIFVKDNLGRGLLHVAATVGEVEPFEALMRKGLDPMMEDKGRRTALDVAAACGQRGILKLFGKEGLAGEEEKDDDESYSVGSRGMGLWVEEEEEDFDDDDLYV